MYPPLKAESGTYALILRCPSERSIEVGKLGRLNIRKGYYIYIGSAFGPGGVLARVGRHLRIEKAHRWHIDYLRPAVSLTEVWYSHDPRRREIAWAGLFLKGWCDAVPIPGFGAGDSRLESHLFYITHRPDVAKFRRRLKRFISGHHHVGQWLADPPIGSISPEKDPSQSRGLVKRYRCRPAEHGVRFLKRSFMEFHNCFVPISSAFGVLGMVWRETESGPRVHQILLPNEKNPPDNRLAAIFPHPVRRSCAPVVELAERIQAFLSGEAIRFELDWIALDNCSEFQRLVLLAEHRIPRGWVSTYGRIARSLGLEGGARAVGNALARNPFPIVIPCHRTIRAGGELGEYQGGANMKRALLKMEGVEVSERKRVALEWMYY